MLSEVGELVVAVRAAVVLLAGDELEGAAAVVEGSLVAVSKEAARAAAA